MAPEYDAIVVGGGPGGSTAATLVAKRGGRVLLLEREHFPRYQIGESLLPSTTQIICRLLGVHQSLQAEGFTVKRGGTFQWGRDEEPWTFHFAQSSVTRSLGFVEALQVERSRFDELLLRNAADVGVQVRQGATVHRVVRDDGRVSGVVWEDDEGVEHRATASWVVDASGHKSRLHPQVGKRHYSEFFRNCALFGYYENGRRLAGEDAGNVLSVAFEDGWFWYIPLSPTLTSVGVVVDHHAAQELSGAEAMERFVAKCPLIAEYLRDARRVTTGPYGKLRIRRDYSYCADRLAVPGMMLVGDAACFIDPVFSTGVHAATYAGLLAARVVNTCRAGTVDESTCLAWFERRYRAEYAAQYKFLLGFYDMNASRDTYFWRARSVLGTQERDNDAFVRLVAGAGTTVSEFFGELEGAGRALHASVARARGDRAAADTGRAAFAVERSEGSARDLVPTGWLNDPTRVHGANIPGSLIPTRDGLAWERVAVPIILVETTVLRATSVPSWERRTGDRGAEVFVRFGGVELLFDTPDLVAFAEKLVHTPTFRADEARLWAAKGTFRWEDVRRLLDDLVAEGVLEAVP
ncbi:MAG: tryptophan 7-halogenase [Myxococcales bacterium FL481]|nr:MAG: tryptophan 7-halogenase [Myxococcales bacterium FL481]